MTRLCWNTPAAPSPVLTSRTGRDFSHKPPPTRRITQCGSPVRCCSVFAPAPAQVCVLARVRPVQGQRRQDTILPAWLLSAHIEQGDRERRGCQAGAGRGVALQEVSKGAIRLRPMKYSVLLLQAAHQNRISDARQVQRNCCGLSSAR
jgi:hypothetical protein